jgi:low affinity Fe/Cu permease
VTEAFGRFARWAARFTGSAAVFVLALGVIVVWGISGPLFHFNDTWQLAINTGTTIVTFLMVFLIQSSQNRDSTAIQLKLDELIHAGPARNKMIDLEEDTEAVLQQEQERFRTLAKHLQESSGGELDLGKALEDALQSNGKGTPEEESAPR